MPGFCSFNCVMLSDLHLRLRREVKHEDAEEGDDHDGEDDVGEVEERLGCHSHMTSAKLSDLFTFSPPHHCYAHTTYQHYHLLLGYPLHPSNQADVIYDCPLRLRTTWKVMSVVTASAAALRFAYGLHVSRLLLCSLSSSSSRITASLLTSRLM